MAKRRSQKTSIQLMREEVRKSRPHKFSFRGYCWTQAPMNARIAELLDTCAVKYPRCFIFYEEIHQACYGGASCPHPDTTTIKKFREVVRRCAKILHQKYGRALITCRGVGARASTDSLDVVTGPFLEMTERHRRSGEKVVQMDNLVNSDEARAMLEEIDDDQERARQERIVEWRETEAVKYIAAYKSTRIKKQLTAPKANAPLDEET